MARAQTYKRNVVIGKETSFKTLPGTPVGFRLPVSSPNFSIDRATFQSSAQTGSPEPRKVHKGKKSGQGDTAVEASHAALLPTLDAVLGGYRSQGAGTIKVYEFYLDDLDSWAVEEQLTDITQYILTKGFTGNSIDITAESDGLMSVRLAGLSAIESGSGSKTFADVNVTDLTGYDPFSYGLSKTSYNGAKLSENKLFNLAINRRAGTDFEQDETDETATIFSAIAQVTGRVMANITDLTLYDLLMSETPVFIESWVPGDNGLAILSEVRKAVFNPGRRPADEGGLIRLEGTYDAQGTDADHPGRAYSDYFTSEDLNTLTLLVSVDGGANQTVTFASDGMSPDAVVTQINTDVTGATASVRRKAGDTGGIVVIESDTVGASSSIQVDASSTADALLGFDNVQHDGLAGKSVLITVFSSITYAA